MPPLNQTLVSAIGRIATVWFDRRYPWSDLGLFSHLKSIIYLDPKIPDGAFQLSVAQQQLYGPEILRPAVDERPWLVALCGYRIWRDRARWQLLRLRRCERTTLWGGARRHVVDLEKDNLHRVAVPDVPKPLAPPEFVR